MKPLLYLPNLLIIGGSSRNIGKTTLALNLVHKYSGSENITGLKVTSIRPGEESFHGTHGDWPVINYRILEELNSDGRKDTSKLLNAGAERVFYIESTDAFLLPAFNEFLDLNSIRGPIICESGSLRQIVIPGLFVLLKHHDPDNIKPGFAALEALADIIFTIQPNVKTAAFIADKILWEGDRWRLSREEDNVSVRLGKQIKEKDKREK